MSTYSFFPGMAMGREWLYNTGTFSLSNLLFAFFYLLRVVFIMIINTISVHTVRRLDSSFGCCMFGCCV